MANAREVGPAAIRHRQLLSKTAPSLAALGFALAGASLAFGIMAIRALREGIDCTALSWALIAPIWGLLALLALLVRRWRVAALPLGWLSIFAGVYYADVFGFVPAAGLFLFATLVAFASSPEDRSDEGG